MGAYIFYKTERSSFSVANYVDEFLENDAFSQHLFDAGLGRFTVACQEDLNWAEKQVNAAYWVRYFQDRLGEGDYKVSALDDELISIDPSKSLSFFELSSSMFERLNQVIAMRYLSSSCAFSGDYYTNEQISRITQNGRLLSGVVNKR